MINNWLLTCSPKNTRIDMYSSQTIDCNITDPGIENGYWMIVESDDPTIANARKEIWLNSGGFNEYTKSFNITGQFIGKTKVSVAIQKQPHSFPVASQSVDVVVQREKRVIDVIFHVSVAVMVSLMYVNFGCALQWGELKDSLKRPIGPIIGFIGQFLCMPVISFFVAKALFPNSAAMQLGLFFTGVSPGGGASNMWTVILGGNIDLSITMTTIGTLAAFAMMPLWLFTLGKVLFDEGQLTVPYRLISTYAVTLIVPLAIGYGLKRFFPRIAAFMARILKGFSSLLLIFIVVFAIVTNLYLFELFSWRIVIAGLGLPWLGYLMAWVLAKIARQNPKDSLTIAIETGIQNTGIAIFLLRFTLDQPEADLTTVVPVAVAIMTPIPLLMVLIYQKVSGMCWQKHTKVPNNSLVFDVESEDKQHNRVIGSIS